MSRRLAITAAALAVLALTWTSTVVAFSRCAFVCDMPADEAACPLCESKAPADHTEVDVAIDRSCCDQQFRSEQVTNIEPKHAAAELSPDQRAPAAMAPPVAGPRLAASSPIQPRGPPDARRALREQRTVVLLL